MSRSRELVGGVAVGDIERLRRNLESRLVNRMDAAPPLVRAGVLIPLIRHPGRIDVLFTRRTDTVLTHKGQISFPGGQREDGDAVMLETALRETYEEIGLKPERVEVLGELDEVFTSVSNFVISPFVGLVQPPIDDLRPAPLEVRSLLLVPVERLLEPDVHTIQTREFEGDRHIIHYYNVDEDTIWGVTGRILHQLLTIWQE